ncbi:M15 family metallopeptidase [Aureispira anguillae]|uniref:M15 family metallopeptidase n=1 Tax=Aureispira anguillae TaxID=2864201 RepID=A0A915YK98_9BACT|nr:M15 family metallopeptidase [Aureispira anguillae]BDS14750.1 M15 family metallopeptidase [Aureispira anguillae]
MNNKFLVVLITTVWGLISCSNDANTATATTSNRSITADSMVLQPQDTSAPEIPDSLIQFDDHISPEKRKAIMEKISKKYLMGKFDPAKDERFAKVPSPYAQKELFMRKEALESFKKMHAAAQEEGIQLRIISATRPFNVQKSIWEAKWTGRRKVDGKMLPKTVKDPKGRAIKILRWSSMPSTSRHHWGTDIDINNLEPEYFEKGQGLKEYEWLVAHAGEYGFCQVYSEMGPDRPDGYQEEKWHWSYLPISKALTDAYAQKITDQDIEGFLGAESAPMIEVVKKYVLGINPQCL